MSVGLPFPTIDPVAIHLFGFGIRWYALAYITGIVLGMLYAVWLSRKLDLPLDKKAWDAFVSFAVVGIILGGRLGYCLLYQPQYYLSHPLEIFKVWQGGMAFHGGFLGMVVAIILFARQYQVSTFVVGDVVAAVAPIGLCLGRLANFVNGELFGRVTNVPWAILFPAGGYVPRHPSQLYESAVEGILLLSILYIVIRRFPPNKVPGIASGCFLVGYGLSRLLIEFTREPDAYLGLFYGLSVGQWYSLPMIGVGIGIVGWAWKHRTATAN
jgi:phosphatidylglycerol---prolipoprotein diacylglyceryl transferase